MLHEVQTCPFHHSCRSRCGSRPGPGFVGRVSTRRFRHPRRGSYHDQQGGVSKGYLPAERGDPSAGSRNGQPARAPAAPAPRRKPLRHPAGRKPIPVRRHLQARHHLGDPDLESGFDLHGARRPGELRVVRERQERECGVFLPLGPAPGGIVFPIDPHRHRRLGPDPDPRPGVRGHVIVQGLGRPQCRHDAPAHPEPAHGFFRGT